MGTPNQTDLYCAASGNGKFIVRGFGPAPFKMNGFLGETNDAVHKALGSGQPVIQDIALSVKGSKVECSINGAVVASYDKAALVTDGKLKSTDGLYGLRFAHNTGEDLVQRCMQFLLAFGREGPRIDTTTNTTTDHLPNGGITQRRKNEQHRHATRGG